MSTDNPDFEPPQVNLFTPEFAACPQAAYREVLDKCPVARTPLNNAAVIFAYDEVVWALRHPEIFSSDMWEEMRLGNDRPMIPQQLDPPLQTKFRKILDPQFSRKRMLAIDPPLRRHANELIDSFIDAGECEFDSQFAIPLPCAAFLELFGLPQEDLDLFLRLKDGIIRPTPKTDDPDEPARVRAAAGRELYDYFERVIADRVKRPRDDDMVSYLLGCEISGEKISHNDILDICYLQLIAGLDTVTSTLGCNIAYLGSNPEQRKKIVDDPSMIPGAIEELLRWESPVMMVPRLVKEDVELGGVKIKTGETILLMLGAADIDRGAFPDADVVDFGRERNRHIAFGAGAHRCLGSHLARIELTAAMEEWHRRIPDYSIKPDETPLYSFGIHEVQYLPLVWPVD